uniref:Exostosin GT47 domain-containing protein n=1 Tax=Physcomitrium patens TaxID=3218 RepID=A0A7I4DXB6_PHYPA
MREKNAPQGHGHKVLPARHRTKLLLPFCLLVVGIVWSSSSLAPFSSVAEFHIFRHQVKPAHQKREIPEDNLDAVGASETIHLKEALSLRDGRDTRVHTRSQLTAGKRTKTSGEATSTNEGQAGMTPKKILVKDSAVSTTAKDEDSPVTSDPHFQEKEEDSYPDKPVEMEEMDILRTKLSLALMQKENSLHGGDCRITGDLIRRGNRFVFHILDEIRGKYIYVYDLPPEFNVDLVKRCDSLLPWFGLCEYFENSGLGKPVASDQRKNRSSQILQPIERWFNTHHKAPLFYVPYYGGVDVIRWHWALNATNEKQDALGRQLVRWLEKQPS